MAPAEYRYGTILRIRGNSGFGQIVMVIAEGDGQHDLTTDECIWVTKRGQFVTLVLDRGRMPDDSSTTAYWPLYGTAYLSALDSNYELEVIET